MYCLWFGLLELSNCCLRDLKTWRDYSIGWESIPLDNSKWKEGVFVVILASMNLTECHRVAKSENPMCWLYVVGKGHSHEAVSNFVEETEMGHRLSLFKGLPVLLRPGCTSLDHFYFV